MELTIDEVYFVKTAVGQCQIKASDAYVIGQLMNKIDEEFSRLQKIQEEEANTEAKS